MPVAYGARTGEAKLALAGGDPRRTVVYVNCCTTKKTVITCNYMLYVIHNCTYKKGTL